MIPADIIRCRPGCGQKHDCLRFLEPIPAYGGGVRDFSLSITTYCMHQLPRGCEKYIEPEPKKAVKPWPVAE